MGGFDLTTFALELVNFGVLVVLLQRFLFRPVRDIIAKRRAEIEARGREMAAREAAADELREGYEARRKALDDEATALIDDAQRRAHERAEAIVADARKAENELMRRTSTLIEQAREDSVRAVREDVARVAVEATKRVLAASQGDTLAESFARSAAEAYVDEHGTPSPDAAVTVWLSPDADETRVREVVIDGLKARGPCELRRDPTLWAGVRLLVGDVEVAASADRTLREWIASSEGAADDPTPDEPTSAAETAAEATR